ncbi:uncharacterized protein MCYG_07293 [Microsporum canis CBS 113480]|uniref:Uncharacterized protein n=1 Tax=Arthroderma otae (strain ATCC MYA-4605 / CBS 113480) TaxID=554155 RepID=C5FY76_ARTOC|nr:uncharacterized protein MCYG_07293 [Microsporum canis CBS 113480]EEQ34474.1 predicted protein [Microsporum canis CBS 113480]
MSYSYLPFRSRWFDVPGFGGLPCLLAGGGRCLLVGQTSPAGAFSGRCRSITKRELEEKRNLRGKTRREEVEEEEEEDDEVEVEKLMFTSPDRDRSCGLHRLTWRKKTLRR